MADPTGIPTPPPLGGVPSATPGTLPASGPSIPTFAAPVAQGVQAGSDAAYEARGQNWVWDKLGRWLTGGELEDEQGSHGGALPGLNDTIVGDILRAPGALTENLLTKPLGFGLGQVVEAGAAVAGALPSASGEGLGTNLNSAIDPFNPKYDPAKGGADAAMSLFVDLRNQPDSTHNMAAQFLVIGKWMKQYDPEAFAEWEKALATAQGEAGFGAHGVETISNFISEWGTTYADMTTYGLEDYLETAPELYFGGAGSFGQGLVRDLGVIFNLQRHAEKGAAAMTGSRGGGIGPIPVGIHNYYAIDGVVQQDVGSRLNELRWALANEPAKMTDVERHAAMMFESGQWDAQHSYNFLVSKGQGYSSNAAANLVLSFATDPLQVASMGGGLAASIGGKAAYVGGKTAVSSSRLAQMYEAGARSIGTTVKAVRADPILGPAAKVARTIIDPFSALPGPAGAATKDVMASSGLEAARRGYGASAVTNAARRAKEWGISDVFTRDFAVTATNYARKWVSYDYVGNILRYTDPTNRQIITPELVDDLAKNAPKDAVTRMADFVQKHKQVWLRAGALDQLASRMAKATGKTKDEMAAALKTMSPDEQSFWHALTYSNAWTHFKSVVASVPVDEWGHLAQRLPDMVILNPTELDKVAAQALHKTLTEAKTVAERIKLWNEAADMYGIIDEIGRVPANGKEMMARHLDYLERIINQGGLHTALSEAEMAALPKKFVDEFLNAWTEPGLVPGVTDNPLWRVGFKPMAEQATGLVQNAEGEFIQLFSPTIDNVSAAPGMMARRYQPLTDYLGRVVGDPLLETKAGRAMAMGKDAMEVAINTARDHVSGQRIIQGIEHNFVRSVKSDPTLGPLLSEKKLRTIFRLSRDAAQEEGFTLAGLGPKAFWTATEKELAGILEARVVKRELFGYLAEATAGDIRTLGLTGHLTQRIRGGLVARGIDPNNYMGAVTVQMYNMLRYTLNPTFFLQSVFDAPWFNAYRGIIPIGGKAPKSGTPLYDMERITHAMGRTGLSRDLQMDFTERVATIGWQRDVVDRLGQLPGVKEHIGNRLKNWTGRMILNNELAYVNSQIGNVVFDALDSTRKVLDEKIANSLTDIERQGWQAVKQDQIKMLDDLTERMTAELDRVPTREEVGRRYLTEMIDDSRLEVRTPEGLLNYKKVMSKGEYIKPTDVGQIKPLDLEYGVEALGLPNIHSVTDLRLALAEKRVFIGDVKDILKANGFHKDAIKRFTKAVTFNWRHYFDDLATELKLTRYEMQGVEDIINRAAKAADMKPVEYLTQVIELADDAGLDPNVRFIVQTQKAIAKGEAKMDDIVRLASMHLQPSMRNRLVNHFMQALEGTDGLIQKAMDMANATTDPVLKQGFIDTSQQLNKVLEGLKGGWGKDAERMYRDLIVRRAGGEVTALGDTLPQPWKTGKHAMETELVRVDDIVPLREIDRNVTPKVPGDTAHLDALAEDIRVNGFKEPITVVYDPDLGRVMVTDGDHRLAAAQRLGLENVPVRVEKGSLLWRGKPEPASRLVGDVGLTPGGSLPDKMPPSKLGFKPATVILDEEVERGARFFSQYIQSIDPKVLIGNELNAIVDNIPVKGASPFDYSQGLLMNTMAENFRLAEKDAIRLAHIQPDRSVLERSLNHPFFGMYPSSYFWGKVIPETFKFIALEPFGMKTTMGAMGYLKVQQSIALQSQYDPRMAQLWEDMGKSAVVNLLAYLSPSMPWEEMKSNLPPWARVLAKDGFDLTKMYEAQFRTMSPERWVNHFTEAAGEIGDFASDMIPDEPTTPVAPGGMSIPGQQGLEDIVQQAAPLGGEAPATPQGNIPPTKGADLAPVLIDEMTELEKWLSGN